MLISVSSVCGSLNKNYRFIHPNPIKSSLIGFLKNLDFNKKKQYIFDITTEYGRSYNSGQMAKTLISNESFEIAGSNLPQRNNTALVADYFGLSDQFHSKVTIKPTIALWHTTITGRYQFLNDWKVLFDLTLGVNSNHLGFQETVSLDSQNTPYQAGMMNFNINSQPPHYTSFTEASKSLVYGSFSNKKESGFLQARAQIKKLLWNTDTSHAILGGTVIIPGKKNSKKISFFEPAKGIDHWGIGFLFEAKNLIWSNFEHLISICATVEAFYFFNHKTTRIFDLNNNGFLSRYLLLKEFTNGVVSNIVQASTITTQACTIKLPFLFETTLLFTYENENFNMGIGYDGWIRSTEKISKINKFPENRYGIKGLTPVFNPITGQNDNTTQNTSTLFSTSNRTDQSTHYLSPIDLNKKSAASSLSVIHNLCACLIYQNKTAHKETFVGITIMIEFEGLDERYNNRTTESDPTFVRCGLTAGLAL